MATDNLLSVIASLVKREGRIAKEESKKAKEAVKAAKEAEEEDEDEDPVGDGESDAKAAEKEPAPKPDDEEEPEDDKTGEGDTKPTGPDPALVAQVARIVKQEIEDEKKEKKEKEIKISGKKEKIDTKPTIKQEDKMKGRMTFKEAIAASILGTDKIYEGYEGAVLNILDTAGIRGPLGYEPFFENGKLYVERGSEKEAKQALKDDGSIRRIPKIVGEELAPEEYLQMEAVSVDGRLKGFKEALKRLTYEKIKAMKEKEEVEIDETIEVPEGLSKEDAAAFMAAASAAKRAGKKKFKLGGKEYPVTIKVNIPSKKNEDLTTEEIAVDEARKTAKDIGMECQECGKKFRAKLSTLQYGKTKCPKCKSTDIDFSYGESVEVEEARSKEDELELAKVIAAWKKAGGKIKKLPPGRKFQSLFGKGYKPKKQPRQAEEVEIQEHCGECEFGLEERAKYDLYHKTFSAAMQHAYDVAKKQGYIVDPDEIDNKVATGPRKPSSGKTNRYILGTDKKKNLHVQVANLDNKRYELNMYIEGVEIDEKFKKGKYTLRDGNTGKVIATYNSGAQAAKEMHKLLDSGKYDELEVKMEEVEPIKEADRKALKNFSKELSDYARKSGGIDKADFEKVAKIADSGKMPKKNDIPDDTDPRDFVLMMMMKYFEKRELKMYKGLSPTFDSWLNESVQMTKVRRLRTKINEALDREAVRELQLYIENDSDLYRRQIIPIVKNIQRKMKSGKYDHTKAPKLWMYLVDNGAKKYVKEFGGDVKSMFPKDVRHSVAVNMANEYRAEIESQGGEMF